MLHKQRLQYIDSLRGFAMLLVVIHHVSLYSLNAHPAFSLNTVFLTFRMPLFFFLSGFLFYKPFLFTDKNSYLQFLRKKFKVQIVPTVIFGSLFAFLLGISLLDMLFHQTKHGYWFTIILFIYFFLFSSTSFIFKKIIKNCSEGKILFTIFLLALIISIPSFALDHNLIKPINKYFNWSSAFLSFNKWWYFVYFVFGAIIRQKRIEFNKLKEPKFISLVLIAEILLLLLRLTYDVNSIFCLFGVIDYFLGFLGIIIVVTFFSKNEISFSKDTVIGRSLQYIGERTLDIYLLHYFFVPRNLEMIGQWLEINCNPILELFIEIIIALIVITVCLVSSKTIRISDYLAKLLFGKVLN